MDNSDSLMWKSMIERIKKLETNNQIKKWSKDYYIEQGSSLDGRGIWGRMETCICMAESLHCSLETIGYTLIQNKKFLKN